MTFRLSADMELPANAATQTFAFLGRRGSGKTYAAGKLAELLLGGDAQVVIVDPVGVWFGLRLSADGKSPGIAIPVFGGQHGDIPLEATAGAVVAKLVAERGMALVLDVSEFTGADQRRFVADFASELLHLKKRNRSPLMTIWDEAQEFVPQLVRPDHARMVGAMEKLVKLGRNFGVGVTLISQRPQAVHKDVLNQTEVLMVFQLTGPQERKVIAGWVNDHGFGQQEVDELPRLPAGTAFVWSPQWLARFARVKIARKTTFDASATPEEGTVVAAGAGAAVDLAEVRAAMAATIEAAKDSDPKALRAEIARLRAELATGPGRSEMVAKISEDAVRLAEERDRLLAEAEEREQNVVALQRIVDETTTLIGSILRTIETSDYHRTIGLAIPGFHVPATPSNGILRTASQMGPGRFQELAPPPPRPARADTTLVVRARGHHGAEESTGESLPLAVRRALTVLAQFADVTRRKLGIMAGYAPSGSSMRSILARVRAEGLAEDLPGDRLRITPAGRKRLGPWVPLPTGEALLAHWIGELPEAAARILRALAQAYPRDLDKAALAKVTSYEEGGSSMRAGLARLRGLDLVTDTNDGTVRAAVDLFSGRAA